MPCRVHVEVLDLKLTLSPTDQRFNNAKGEGKGDEAKRDTE